jgi:hypothetical protein
MSPHKSLWDLEQSGISPLLGGNKHMATSKPLKTPTSNVVDLFTRKPFGTAEKRKIIRLSPELDGLEMLYSNDSSDDKLFSMKILCWGLFEDGEVVGMVPWLNKIVPCTEIADPLNGHWEGYYDPGIEEIFYHAPTHKVVELETAADYYHYESNEPNDVIQEIPDHIGTHAVFTNNGFRNFTLVEIFSWRLYNNGDLFGMVISDEEIHTTPVLPGDECLHSAQSREGFKYFFQHRIANKIKAHDEEALAALAMLIEQ